MFAGASLFAEDPNACYVRLGGIQNQSPAYGTYWSYRIPVQMRLNCDFGYNLYVTQKPSGMTFDGNKLHWTPSYSQFGQTFRFKAGTISMCSTKSLNI